MSTPKNSQNKTEKDWYEYWQRSGFFKADPDSNKKPFSLLIPPPNLTGELHLGHAMQHSILDAIARFKRMQGFDVLLLPGVDHAGIQFESTFNKKMSKEGLSKQKLGREKWLEEAWKFKEEVYKSVSSTWRFMGLSADWSREVFTLDEGPKKAVFEEFKNYFEKGLIYKGPYIVQWCPKDQTAIEDVEVEYEERKEKLYFVKYLAPNGLKPIIVATTRPETIFADVAVAVHPSDKRYEKYSGGNAWVLPPLLPTKKPWPLDEIKIVRDKRVDKNFGTGVLKVTPGHDFLDYQIGKDNKLPILNVINKEGKLTEIAGKYAGMRVMEAREIIISDLRASGKMMDEKDYVHNVAVCERCKTVIEPIISEEWFVKVEDMAKDAIKLIKAGGIDFLPKNYAKILSDWLDNIHDWCISRSLWWGHRIPVWYKQSLRSGDLKQSLQFSNSSAGPKNNEMRVSLDSPGPGWTQDEQVLDTWFSSGLWPISTLGWPNKTKEFQKYFPWNFEITAPEIKYLWIARMIMISNYFTGEIPFKTMFFHGMIRDLQGRKFSKSLGNGVEPDYLLTNWGTDATRMTLYSYSIPGRDGRVSKQILDERAKNYRNFTTKISNITRFVIDLKPISLNSSLGFKHKDDVWIKKELNKTIIKVTSNLEKTQLHLACEDIYDFIWHKFADIYIEKAKSRREEAQPVLEYILKTSLLLLHPFMPFISEELYQKFSDKKESIMLESWPKVN